MTQKRTPFSKHLMRAGGLSAFLSICYLASDARTRYEPLTEGHSGYVVDIGPKGDDLVALTKSDTQTTTGTSYDLAFYADGNWKERDGEYQIRTTKKVSLDTKLVVPNGHEIEGLYPSDDGKGFRFRFSNPHNAHVRVTLSEEYHPLAKPN